MSSDQRRTFLKQVGGLAAVAAAAKSVAAPAGPQGITAPSTVITRSYSGGKFALELDGNFAGWVQTAEGGTASAEVVVEKIGPDKIARKHIANVKYEDITIKCDAAMSKAVYNWIASTLDQKHLRKDGAIVVADYQMREISRLSFYSALLTEIGFPACDGASKEPAYMTVKLSPEVTRKTPGFPGRQMPRGEQKKWTTANFKFELEGVPTAMVSKVEALVVKVQMSEGEIGHDRDYGKEPVGLEVPNLAVTFPDAGAESFQKWHEDFVIKGYNGQEDEKWGRLQYLSPNNQQSLFSLNFSHVGIFKLAPEPFDASDNSQQKWRAEMYAEEIKLDAPKG